ncbi:relaxase MobL [Acidipropionibacterium jensenii]|uniref:relaxase MobL n=1 Tax=Acidipropionibacterium jensenii TaxID=1749 RepID=UPI00214C17D1|nr:relaxase MobL [Acidipropionibacterium jensenii]
MSLRSDVVVVNEFSVPTPGGGGTRGGTPGSYVTRYMARGTATETLAPIRKDSADDFIMRYMVRNSAVERAEAPGAAASADRLKTSMRAGQGHGGVAFGYGSVSLSDSELRAASADIQHAFENGHTVLKTVVSFTEDYLRRTGIIAPDFHCTAPGDYRGNIDQMKLRMAVMRGVEALGHGGDGFDDFRYIGVIQVDTEHVHCHLAGYDAGPGHLAGDGTQRGKLTATQISHLRRAADAFLDEKRAVAHLSSAVSYERTNVTTYVKRWAHDQMRSEALPQFLIAALPADRRVWRPGTHDRRMRKADRIVGELVDEALARPGSPLPAALEQVRHYARTRAEREGLTGAEQARLVSVGTDRIRERAVAGVYQLLRGLPDDQLRVRTPVLDIMGMDYQDLATRTGGSRNNGGRDELAEFGMRLRSYGSRMHSARRSAHEYHELVTGWQAAEAVGAASAASRVLLDFYLFEEDYQRRLADKYQHFLPALADTDQWTDRLDELGDYGQRIVDLSGLRHDASLQRMKDPQAAEAMGREIYHQAGGALLTQGRRGRAELDRRLTVMRERHHHMVADTRARMAADGLVLDLVADEASGAHQVVVTAPDGSPAGRLGAGPGVAHPFDEVRGLDLHHLSMDFTRDIEIAPQVLDQFTQAAGVRHHRLRDAMEYLDRSGQAEAVAALPVTDVAAMVRLSGRLSEQYRLEGRAVLPSRLARLRVDESSDRARARSATTRLDTGLSRAVQASVDRSVHIDEQGLELD